MLHSCLPEILQREMQLWERERGRMPTFVEFMAYLEAKFGRAHSESMRKVWHDIQIPKNSGKFTSQLFDEFRVNFKLARADVKDATEDEARRLLIGKLYPFMRKWLVEAESRRMKRNPIVEMIMKGQFTLEMIKVSLEEWIGVTPQKIEFRGNGVYWLHFQSESAARKVLTLHGRSYAGGLSQLQLHVVEQYLTVDEIFSEIYHQLETQERTAEFQRQGPSHFQEITQVPKPKPVQAPPQKKKFQKGGGQIHLLFSRYSLVSKGNNTHPRRKVMGEGAMGITHR